MTVSLSRGQRSEIVANARLCEITLRLAWHWEDHGQRVKARSVARAAERYSSNAFVVARSGVRDGR